MRFFWKLVRRAAEILEACAAAGSLGGPQQVELRELAFVVQPAAFRRRQVVGRRSLPRKPAGLAIDGISIS